MDSLISIVSSFQNSSKFGFIKLLEFSRGMKMDCSQEGLDIRSIETSKVFFSSVGILPERIQPR